MVPIMRAYQPIYEGIKPTDLYQMPVVILHRFPIRSSVVCMYVCDVRIPHRPLAFRTSNAVHAPLAHVTG